MLFLAKAARASAGGEIDGLDVFVFQPFLVQRLQQKIVHIGSLVQGHFFPPQILYASDGGIRGHHDRFVLRFGNAGGDIQEGRFRRLGEDRRRVAGVPDVDAADIHRLQKLRAGGKMDPFHPYSPGFQALFQRSAGLQDAEGSKLLVADPQCLFLILCGGGAAACGPQRHSPQKQEEGEPARLRYQPLSPFGHPFHSL